MKYLFSFLLSCSILVSLNGQIKCSTKDFRITEATVQSWSPGAMQPNSKKSGGLIYQIKINILKTKQLRFDSLYLDGNLLAVEVVKGADRNYAGTLTKGDVVLILARKDNGQAPRKASAKLAAGISKSKKTGDGFISYWIKNKQYVSSVTEFKMTSSQTRNQ